MNNNRHSGSQGQHMQAGLTNHPQHQSRPSYGMNNGLPIPKGQGNGSSTRDRSNSIGQQTQDTGKSPPNVANKNTKHVPCKFFRQGQCQAGTACPFLHTMDPMSHQAPCKYFMKGNCKFGAKCALAHFLPNGHRVSKADLDPMMAMNRQNSTTARDAPPPFPPFDPAYNEPFLGQQGAMPSYFGGNGGGITQDIPFPLEDDSDVYPDRYSNQYSNGNGYDRPVGSPSTSQFGSPPNDLRYSAQKWPSAKDAPLPPSYKNQIPNYAIKGPFGSSVPDKFGLASPTNSSISQPVGSPPARDPQMQTLNNSAVKPTALGASPAQTVETIHRRMMHSERLAREAKGGMASSLPVRNLDNEFGIGSSLLPSEVRDEVMTPEERRQTSKQEQEPIGSWKDQSTGLAIPRRSSNVVGSPPAASSPSRFQSIFEEQRRERNSTIGSVGSPLREHWFPDGNSSLSGRPGAQSAISQALARLELTRTDSTESNGQRGGGLRPGFSRIDRQVSSPGFTPKRIDEEGEGAFFGFEMDDDGTKRLQAWGDTANSGSRKISEESQTTQGKPIGIKNVNRPFFGGFQS